MPSLQKTEMVRFLENDYELNKSRLWSHFYKFKNNPQKLLPTIKVFNEQKRLGIIKHVPDLQQVHCQFPNWRYKRKRSILVSVADENFFLRLISYICSIKQEFCTNFF